jgi:hypothetical protein
MIPAARRFYLQGIKTAEFIFELLKRYQPWLVIFYVNIQNDNPALFARKDGEVAIFKLIRPLPDLRHVDCRLFLPLGYAGFFVTSDRKQAKPPPREISAILQ